MIKEGVKIITPTQKSGKPENQKEGGQNGWQETATAAAATTTTRRTRFIHQKVTCKEASYTQSADANQKEVEALTK